MIKKDDPTIVRSHLVPMRNVLFLFGGEGAGKFLRGVTTCSGAQE